MLVFMVRTQNYREKNSSSTPNSLTFTTFPSRTESSIPMFIAYPCLRLCNIILSIALFPSYETFPLNFLTSSLISKKKKKRNHLCTRCSTKCDTSFGSFAPTWWINARGQVLKNPRLIKQTMNWRDMGGCKACVPRNQRSPRSRR